MWPVIFIVLRVHYSSSPGAAPPAPHRPRSPTGIHPKEIEESGVELGPNRIPIIHTGFTEKTWGSPEFWTQMPYLEAGVGALMASKGAPAVALDVFPEKPLLARREA
jgi:hypothetical protein